MLKIGILLYGIFSYIIALIGQIWFILYLTNSNIIDKNIYSHSDTPLLYALFIDTMLVVLFGLQHSVMARKWFKNHLIKIMPEAMQRSTYVLLSGLVFIIICLYWQPINGILWKIDDDFFKWLLWGGFIFGWVFSVVATFIINHFELFGLQQVYLHLLEKEPDEIKFQEKLFYKFIRHPIQFGVLLGLWITPIMNYGHFVLSLFFTIYIFIGLYYEEQDLIKELGDIYVKYRERVGFMFPKM